MSDSPWNTAHSPFASVLETNYTPSPNELKAIKKLLEYPKEEVSQLKEDIARLQSVLDSLALKKERIETYIDAHAPLVNPVRRLPHEILADIFLYLIPSDRHAVRSLLEAPLLLTRICRDWRQVALQSPRLWTSLHCYFPFHLTADEYAQRTAGMTSWLERSGGLPLSISLHADADHTSGSFVPLSEVSRKAMESAMYKFLMRFRDRIKTVFLSLPPSSFATLIESSTDVFPALVSLRVRDGYLLHSGKPFPRERIPESEIGTRMSTIGPLVARLPSLRKLQIDEFSVSEDYLRLPCTWENLTSITLHGWHVPKTFMSILEQSPQLQSANLGLFLRNFSLVEELPIVSLEDLRELKLVLLVARDAAADEKLAAVLNNIQCPSLRSFELECSNGRISSLPLKNLLTESLEAMKLKVFLTPEAIHDCLSSAPNMVSFELAYHEKPRCFDDSHLARLTASPENPTPAWPRLQSLRILRQAGSLRPDDNPDGTPWISRTPTKHFSLPAWISFLTSRKDSSRAPFSCDVMFAESPLSADGDGVGGASGGETLVSESDEQELLATVRGLVGDVKSGMKLRIVWPDGKKRPRWLDFPEIGLNEVHPGHLIRLHQQYQPVRLDAHELSLPEDLRCVRGTRIWIGS